MASATSTVKFTAKELEAIQVTGFQMPSVDAIKQAISSGKSNYRFVEQRGGCGRVYVCVWSSHKIKVDSKISKKLASAIAKQVEQAVKELGGIFQRKGYGVGDNAIYIGYDNADSIAWSQAVQVATSLKELGLGAYEDGQGD